jgi:hypothetical protein
MAEVKAEAKAEVKKDANLKTTQVQGQRYDLPDEDIRVQKLVKKWATLEGREKKVKAEIEAIKAELSTIAGRRRGDATTVNLKGISGNASITFRESYEVIKDPEPLRPIVGDLFDRFFEEKKEFDIKKDLTAFIKSPESFGLKDAQGIKDKVLTFLKLKKTKPYVKLQVNKG